MASEMTLQEVADTLGITRERVRQIEKKALYRIRSELRKRGITQYSDLSIGDAVVDVLRSGYRPRE